MDRYDHLLKFLIIGDAATGKTCIMRRFLDGKFNENTSHTIGVEFGTKVVQIDGKSVKLQIWDTAGQERFQCVTRSYYRGAVGALVVYDVTNRSSFNAIHKWIASVRELALPNIALILVGNKVDLALESREVSELEAQQCALDNNIRIFLETSAKSGTNVGEAFMKVTREALEKSQNDMQSNRFYPVGIGPAQLTIPSARDSKSRRCC